MMIDKEIIEKTVEVLRQGGVILYPTDTVWGLGCDATNKEAVEKIYRIKKRADSKAMIVLVDSVNNVAKYVKRVIPMADELYEASRGGKPLTLIMPEGVGVAENLLPEERSIAIRVPEHKFCELVLRKLRRPLVSTSANISGGVTPMNFKEISTEIVEGVDYVVPMKCEGRMTGKPSSIIMLGADYGIKVIRE